MPTLFDRHYTHRAEFKDLTFGLHRIQAAADECDIDDRIAKNVIHIAGTNGKGSTALFIDLILRHRGLSTALFTSPHIHTVRERIRLNGENISPEDFDRYTSDLLNIIDKHHLSYFEALTLIGFKYFKDNMPDVAIIETGLGGRLDSTNILNSKIPVITSISIDHTEYLGDTVKKISDEKLGIVKDNKTVFLGHNTSEVIEYIKDKLKDIDLIIPEFPDGTYKGYEPPYSYNLRLAEAVSNYVREGDMPIDLSLPMCRMERFGRFILEGAHNEAGLKLLADRVKASKPVAIFTCTKDRDLNKLYKILAPACSHIIITEIPGSDRSINTDSLDSSFLKAKSPVDAIKLAVELSENTDILVCGSLYLCGYVREIFTKDCS